MLRIKMSPLGASFHINEDHHVEAKHDWLEGTFIQGGDKGLVVSRTKDKPSYTTAFVEAFPPESSGGGFFRGEGSSIAEAETAAWNKWQVSINCPGHEWETRGYTNGAGFCIHCKKFESKVFTGEQLEQFCVVCATGTTYNQIKDSEENDRWYCEDHSFDASNVRAVYLVQLEKDGELTEHQRLELSGLRYVYRVSEDGVLTEKPPYNPYAVIGDDDYED